MWASAMRSFWQPPCKLLLHVRLVSLCNSFMVSSWGPCSATCGVAVRARTVQCRAFDDVTMSVHDLPDSSCSGKKGFYRSLSLCLSPVGLFGSALSVGLYSGHCMVCVWPSESNSPTSLLPVKKFKLIPWRKKNNSYLNFNLRLCLYLTRRLRWASH